MYVRLNNTYHHGKVFCCDTLKLQKSEGGKLLFLVGIQMVV
jgi:hypothetical protein